ncbi:MAG: V-type ATP synthase subunit A [Trueperaceae bacterium]|nr:V-type ATP synthase subunit A [Trueperaceae bacterium]
MSVVGTLLQITGPIARMRLSASVGVLEHVWVGHDRLAAEVISIDRDRATVQIYEETTGLRPGEPVVGTGHPLSVLLGPGLIGQTFDGIQRPLEVVRDAQGIYLKRGAAEGLPARRWAFTPTVSVGDRVTAGAVLGTVPETPLVTHRVLVPPQLSGEVEHIADEGELGAGDTVARLRDDEGESHEIGLTQRWPVRRPRPFRERRDPDRPMITGQRVLDTFFPVARGGSAALPGPFGAGKTVLQHSLAKWSDAQVIVYVGCGERGNEMAQVLQEFPALVDPRSGRPLMDRTILVANTSNMPVAAREASVYTGITLAEYYRDQGYHVALMADSTSRWAEALREIAGRLEEMPAEEGYPAYLPSRLAAFYERAGQVETLAGDEGSVTVIGAVSPPGGDFTEPVTQHTQRFTRAFWALDRDLASARHYPAVSWKGSYSFYDDAVADWWRDTTEVDWLDLRRRAGDVLEEDARLEQMVRLVGVDALPDRQRWVIEVAGLLKEGVLRQNALHDVDAFCEPAKQVRLLALFVELHDAGLEAIEAGVPLLRLRESLDRTALTRLKETIPNDETYRIDEVWTDTRRTLAKLRAEAEQDEGAPA